MLFTIERLVKYSDGEVTSTNWAGPVEFDNVKEACDTLVNDVENTDNLVTVLSINTNNNTASFELHVDEYLGDNFLIIPHNPSIN